MMTNRLFGCVCVAAGVGLLMLPAGLRAESDADRVPVDAVAYLHWAGTDAVQDEYQQSHLKGLVDAIRLEAYIRAAMDKQVAAAPAEKQQKERMAHEIVLAAMKAPTSVYVGPVDFSDAGHPMPSIAIFSKIGATEAAADAEKLNGMKPAPSEKAAPLLITTVGDYLLIDIGNDTSMAKRLTGPVPTDGLGESQVYTDALKQLGPAVDRAPLLLYISGEAALRVADDAAANNSRGRGWPIMESLLGLTEIKQVAVAAGFDGPDWRAQGFIGMGDHRTGLLDFLDATAIGDETYKLIPANATWAGVFHFDGLRLLDDARNAAGQMGPRGQQQFDFALRQFFAFTGVDLKNDLLGSVSDQYVFYAAPDARGKSMHNAVFINHLKDSKKANTALSQLETTINAMMTQRNPASSVEFKTEPLAPPHENVTAHVLTLPDGSPAWAIVDDLFYVAGSKAALQNAIDSAGKGGDISSNPAFASLRQSLGQQAISGFTFLDLPKLAPEEYEYAQKLLARKKMDPPYTLPPLEQIVPNLGPFLQETWTDAAGFHVISKGPFPAAGAVLSPGMLNLQEMQRRAKARREEAATQPKDNLP